MTDDELREMEKRLYASDDAMVWAKEFCEMFNERTIVDFVPTLSADKAVGPDTMAGWFANAMETATYLRGLKDRG